MQTPLQIAAALVFAVLLSFAAPASASAGTMPRYDHIFVIIEENHSAKEIFGSADAPVINRLAAQYGLAKSFYAEAHPSEPNYVALVGGDTFGISDDDAYYCKAGVHKYGCDHSGEEGYVDHTVTAPSLASQLTRHGLSWKGYFESIPVPGSDAYRWPSPATPVASLPNALYAVKHNGFMTFKDVQDDPKRSAKIVGIDAFLHDVDMGELPTYAQIVPNQCDDMHGLHGDNVLPDCQSHAGLIARADKYVAMLTGKLMSSSAWKGQGNMAIVITFDEDDDRAGGPTGCCGTPDGGGLIPTIVITNHGPRGLVDSTPYNHYSLLRTTEAAFGLNEYLGHAADKGAGVVEMAPLFAIKK
jgi:phospholipase C